MANAETNGQGNSLAYRVLHFYRNRVMNLLIFLILVIYLVAEVSYNIPLTLRQSYTELLQLNASQVEYLEEYVEDVNEFFRVIQDEDYLFWGQLYASRFDKGTDPAKIIASLNDEENDSISLFYLKNDGTLVSDPDRAELKLTASQRYQLKKEGYLQLEGDDTRYFSVPCKVGYLIERVDKANAKIVQADLLQYLSLNGFIFNNETLEVVEKDDPNFPSSVSSMYMREPFQDDAFTDPDLQIVLLSPYNHGLAKYLNMKLAAIAPLSYQLEGYSYCVYLAGHQIVFYLLVQCGVPALLCLAFIFLSIYSAMYFRKKEKNNSHAKTIRLPFHCYINLKLSHQILFTQLVLAILVIFCSVSLLILNRLSIYNINHQFYTEQFININESCSQLIQVCSDAYTEPALEMADAANSLLAEEDLEHNSTAKEFMRQLVSSTYIKEISIYDRNGENVYTTADYAGYPLSQDKDSQQYQLQTLMTDNAEPVVFRSDSDANVFYCAESRSDAVGVILLKVDAGALTSLENELSSKTIAANLDFCDSYLFVDPQKPETYYQIASDATTTEYSNTSIPVLANREKFCGFRTVENKFCFISGMGSSSYSIFYVGPVTELLSHVVQSELNLVFLLLILSVLILLGCAVYCPQTGSTEGSAGRSVSHRAFKRMQKRVVLSDNTLDSQLVIWKHGLYYVLGLVAVVLLLDLLVNQSYLIIFMHSGNWEKGVNIFSLSLILLAILAVFVVSKLLNLLFNGISANLPPRSVTACQMVHSIISIVIVVWLLLYSAGQLGINTRTIVASIGVSGLILGLAAKDTINDMLNGIFIILDKRIQVGDYIEVGGFYGRVAQIGIRTTKVSIYNKEKSINNSAMVNVVNFSRGSSAVVVNFTVPFDTDLKFLSDLLTSSTQRFQDYCEGKLKGDVIFLDVAEFCSYGMKCMICIPADEGDRSGLTAKCNRVLKEILDENGICLAQETKICFESDGKKSDYLKKKQKVSES